MEGCNGGVTRCEDGKYRWLYEYHMLKNPTVFFTVLKILMIGGCAPALITALSSLKREGLGALVSGAQVYGVVLLISLPVTLLAYFILAAMYGWKYIVLFEMDDAGVAHIQQPKQFKKAQGIAWLMMLSGAAANDLGMTGRGALIAKKNAISSDFPMVRSVRGLRHRDTIKLDQPLSHNQIYVKQEDYDFVWDYIASRCENAKIR